MSPTPSPATDALTIGERLDRLAARQHGLMFTSRSISEPLLRALHVKRQIWAQEQVVDGLEKPSWAYDVEGDYLAELRDEYRAIVTSAWLHRLAARAGRRAA